jgi:hypothetical protein
MRELVTKYGDHMQTHLVDAIRGHCAQEMRQPGVAIIRAYDLLLTPTIACPPR